MNPRIIRIGVMGFCNDSVYLEESVNIASLKIDRISTHPIPVPTPTLDSQWEQRLKTSFTRLAASQLPVQYFSHKESSYARTLCVLATSRLHHYP
jgi:hypothetical protein